MTCPKCNRVHANRVVPPFYIRSLTNAKEKCKQRFVVLELGEGTEALIINKLVLSKDIKMYGKEFKVLKKFKEYYLFYSSYSIKISTLKNVIDIIGEYKAKKYFKQ